MTPKARPSLGKTWGDLRRPRRQSVITALVLIVVFVIVAILIGVWMQTHDPHPAVIRKPPTQQAPVEDVGESHAPQAAVSPNAQPATPERCAGATSCTSCLLEPFDRDSVSYSGCSWCPLRNKCFSSIEDLPKADQTDCRLDHESTSCPAILHSEVPQQFRVVHVAIRKGGPEALIQLHLALAHWGFNTTLDTRRSKKEKGGEVVPYFRDVYKAEFRKARPLRWVQDYDHWQKSGEEGDVLIATETWRCYNDDSQQWLHRGVRRMQWHLTVWPRRDRSGCTIASHTNFIAQRYMKSPKTSVMMPYISPAILQLAATRNTLLRPYLPGTTETPARSTTVVPWRKEKQNLVMYDSDAKLKNEDLVSPRVDSGLRHETKLASGLQPNALYELYGKMKCGIDLGLPGGERFVYEAALFDVCVVIDAALNGIDPIDFPLPARFRVPAENRRALIQAKDECVLQYADIISEFEPLQHFVAAQRTRFYRSVRRYFSNSAHVVTWACSSDDVANRVPDFITSTLAFLPFATVEVLIPLGMTRDAILQSSSYYKSLAENSWMAAVVFTSLSPAAEKLLCPSTPTEVTFPPSVTRLRSRRSLYTVWMPATHFVTSTELVHLCGTLLSAANAVDAVVVGDNVICGRTERFLSTPKLELHFPAKNTKTPFVVSPGKSTRHIPFQLIPNNSHPNVAGDEAVTGDQWSKVRHHLCWHEMWQKHHREDCGV